MNGVNGSGTGADAARASYSSSASSATWDLVMPWVEAGFLRRSA
jgi:hypothetical protein